MSDVSTRERPPEAGVRRVEGVVNYMADMAERPRYYANDHSRDLLSLDPRKVPIEDARSLASPPSLRREGFELVSHRSAVADFRDSAEVARVHPGEIERLLLEVTGADRVSVTGSGILRFSERLPDAGKSNNSWPARFIHIDLSDPTANQFAERSRPADEPRKIRRHAHYNVWRVLSDPPQDVPLAICDARSFTRADLIEADAIFDHHGQPEWSFESYVMRYRQGHRWIYWSDMTSDEAIVFKTNDSDPAEPHHAPHSAFDDPSAPADAPPRVSIEMRAIAYWFA